MERLIREIVKPDQAAHASALLNDPSDKNTSKIVRQALGNILMERGLVMSEPMDQIILIASQASFAETEEECIQVATIVCRYIHNDPNDIFPQVHQHRGMDLASRCLISLSLFYKAMEFTHQRRGAPSPSFYRQIGRRTFLQHNHRDIADHFQFWEAYLNEHLVSHSAP